MASLQRAMRVLLAVIALVAVCGAQVRVNGIDLTTSGGQPVNPEPNVDTNVGAVVTLRNDGPADVVLTVHGDDGALLAEVGIANGSNFNVTVPANIGVGDYEIRLRASGDPISQAVMAAKLHVHPTE